MNNPAARNGESKWIGLFITTQESGNKTHLDGIQIVISAKVGIHYDRRKQTTIEEYQGIYVDKYEDRDV